MQAVNYVLPFCKQLSAREFRAFDDDYRRYSLQCQAMTPPQDPLPPIVLMSRSVARLIELRVAVADHETHEDFLTAISRAFFSPRSNVEALRQLRDLSMKTRPTVDQTLALRYLQEFDRHHQSITDDVMPSDRQLRKTFIAGLQPDLLRERVKISEPDTFDEAKLNLMTELEDLLTLQSQLAPVEAELRPAPRPAPAQIKREEPSRPRTQSQPRPAAPPGGRPTPVCHGCGHEGHLRPDCPHKTNQGFFKTGKREHPIKLKTMSTSDNVLRAEVTVRPWSPANDSAPHEPITAHALLDTGAADCFIAPDLAKRLIDDGAVVYNRVVTIETANGPVSASRALLANVRFNTSPHSVGTTVSAIIYDAGEPLIVGYPLIKKLDLLRHLASRSGPEFPLEVSPLDEPATPDADVPAIIDAVAQRHAAAFDETLPREGADVEPMVIELIPGAAAPADPPRRLSPNMESVVTKEVESLLEQGIIRPSTSPYAAPAFVVSKSDGSPRMVVDYRRLNLITQPNRFPMQNTRAILGRLQGSKVFCTLDLRSGYHQVPLTDAAIPMTAFTTPSGLYEYTKVPFGLCNAPSHFQRMMMTTLSGLLGRGVECYLDDVIIHADRVETLAELIEQVLQRVEEHNLRLKRSKCTLFAERLEFIGHVISSEGISIAPWRKAALQNIMPPTTPTEVRAFAGLANYFREHVANFSTLMAPLYSVCGSKSQFQWESEQQEAFTAVTRAIVHAPVLAHLDYSLNIIVRTDASTKGCGAVLLQQDELGNETPVAFVSHTFTETEQRWATIEQEGFGIIFAVLKFEPFVKGHDFELQTDHANLTHMHTSKTPKVVRWSLRLQEFRFVIHHIPGVDNTVPDALSRCLRMDAVMAPERKDELLASVHGATAGHMGQLTTAKRLKDRGLTWPGMTEDVKSFIKACPTCQKVRAFATQTVAVRRPTFTSEPFATLAIDTVGPYPEDSHGCKFVLTVVCMFTRFVELVPMRSTAADEAVRALLTVTGRYGAPFAVRSDQGSQFTAGRFREVLSALGIKHVVTLPYHHQANGLVERVNKELNRHMSALNSDLRVSNEWSTYLPLAQRIINAQTHLSTGVAPATLVFGAAVNLDRGVVDNFEEGGEARPLIAEAQTQLIAAARLRQEETFTSAVAESSSFAVGALVLVTRPGRRPHRLAPELQGPYRVLSRENDIYAVENPASGREAHYHILRLRVYDSARTQDVRAVVSTDDDSYVVECIVDHELGETISRHMFLVRWDGYLPEDDQWLPYASVRDLEALDRYLKDHPDLSL